MTELAAAADAGLEGLNELAAVAGEVARDRAAGWARWADLGWLSLLVPEERDGAGADERAAAVVARELGRACRREPFVAAAGMTTSCLAALPASDAVDELLAAVMAGERLAVLAWQPESGDLPTGVPGALSPRGDLSNGVHEVNEMHASCVPLSVTLGAGRELNGSAYWVPTADADVWLVAARHEDDVALVRVDRDTPGLTVHPGKAADGTTYSRLEFVDVYGTLLRGAAASALTRAFDTAALITAAELLGLIDRMLELTLAYLGSRRQFGRPIGTFQVLQHRAVDMWVQQRLAEAALEGALRRVTAPGVDPVTRAAAASSAKSRASAAALKVAGEAVQLHGAIGFTDEYELGGYVNRAMVLAARLGNSRAHARRHGRLVTR